MSLLDFIKTPEGQGLLSMVAGGIAGAQRGTPWNNLGRAGLAGLSGYAGAQDRSIAAATAAEAKRLRDMQMAVYTDQAAERAGAKKWHETFGALAPDTPAIAGQPERPAQLATPEQYGMGGQSFQTLQMAQQAATPQQLSWMRGQLNQTPIPRQPITRMEAQADSPMVPAVQGTPAFSNQPAREAMLGQQFSPVRDQWLKQMITPKPDFDVAEGGTRYSGVTNLPIATGKPKDVKSGLESGVLGYLAVRGIDPKTATPAQLLAAETFDNAGKDRRAPKVTVVNEGPKAVGKGMGELAIKYREDAYNAYRIADEINYVTDALVGYSGGPITSAKAYAGRFLPNDTTWGKLTSLDELARTVQAKLAPMMRVAGSGSTTDFEMRLWMNAVPTLMTSEPGRELMRKYTNRVAERAAYRAQLESDAVASGDTNVLIINQKMAAKFGDSFIDVADRKAMGVVSTKSTASKAAINDLKMNKNNPKIIAEYDAEFGAGAAALILGGK